MPETIRPPSAAGSYYPAEPKRLATQIESYLDNVNEPLKKAPQILIVPHAGLPFSGPTAAYGFKQLAEQPIERVILLGGSHQVPFDGVAVSPESVWQTPLGNVSVDRNLTEKLLTDDSLFFENQQIHQQEHSLEVELPFLQVCFSMFPHEERIPVRPSGGYPSPTRASEERISARRGNEDTPPTRTNGNFTIVPLLIGSEDKTQAQKLTRALAPELDDKTILIVSSDLSHYPTYEIANEVDQKFIEAVLSLNIDRLEKVNRELLDAGHQNLLCCACALGAVKTAVLTAKEIGITKTQLLSYSNSGDTGGDWDRVVGYAAMSFQ